MMIYEGYVEIINYDEMDIIDCFWEQFETKEEAIEFCENKIKDLPPNKKWLEVDVFLDETVVWKKENV